MAGFNMPDIIVESVIRDGISNLKANPALIDDIFQKLTLPFANRKYGQEAIDSIKTWIANTGDDIAVVHSMMAAPAKIPCYSIQLGSDVEDKRLAHLEDYEGEKEIQLLGVDLLPYQKETNVIPDAYIQSNGMLQLPDSVDLSDVYPGYIFVDASNNEFEIKSGMSDELGDKFLFLDPNLNPNLTGPCIIKSPINSERFEVKGVLSDVQLLIGVHTKDALTTKYMYILLKHILLSRKKSLILRGFIVSSYSGSDFTRDMKYEGDIIYTRFLTLTGKVQDSWSSDQVDDVDSAIIDTKTCENCD